MNDAPLMEAYEELRTLLAHPSVPERVVSACMGLSQFQTKLFCTVPDRTGPYRTVPDGYRAGDWSKGFEDTGALDGDGWGLRLEPSNFLRELLAALRAFEWPKVLVLIHETCSPCGELTLSAAGDGGYKKEPSTSLLPRPTNATPQS
jgi:hypothetical protein